MAAEEEMIAVIAIVTVKEMWKDPDMARTATILNGFSCLFY